MCKRSRVCTPLLMFLYKSPCLDHAVTSSDHRSSFSWSSQVTGTSTTTMATVQQNLLLLAGLSMFFLFFSLIFLFLFFSSSSSLPLLLFLVLLVTPLEHTSRRAPKHVRVRVSQFPSGHVCFLPATHTFLLEIFALHSIITSLQAW